MVDSGRCGRICCERGKIPFRQSSVIAMSAYYHECCYQIFQVTIQLLYTTDVADCTADCTADCILLFHIVAAKNISNAVIKTRLCRLMIL